MCSAVLRTPVCSVQEKWVNTYPMSELAEGEGFEPPVLFPARPKRPCVIDLA